jgi:hypothetical protein
MWEGDKKICGRVERRVKKEQESKELLVKATERVEK